jgi:hypothetical protein
MRRQRDGGLEVVTYALPCSACPARDESISVGRWKEVKYVSAYIFRFWIGSCQLLIGLFDNCLIITKLKVSEVGLTAMAYLSFLYESPEFIGRVILNSF